MPSSPSTSGTVAAPNTDPSLESSLLVYRIDIFFLIVILIFATFNAPRAIARFARRSKRFQGFILRSATLRRNPRINLNTNSIYLNSDPQKAPVDLDDETTEHVHLPYASSQWSHNEKALPLRPLATAESALSQQDWHMPMLSSLVPRLATLLHLPVYAEYSLGQVLLMAAYGIVILFAGFHKSNPFLDYERSGWVAISQLPFIYILATKNNMIGMLVGLSYEKLNYLHRFAGRLLVFAVNVHAIGFIYQWSIAGDLSANISKPSNMWGLIALVCADMLGIFSLQCVRMKSYNLFFVTHATGLIIVLFAVCYHKVACVPYVIVACVFYGLDHLIRVIKTHITTATLRPIPELGLTRVEIPSINDGWRAGQHVRLRVLSTAIGFWRIPEVHPFTISSVSKTEEGLVLLCKKAGKWTTKMYEMAGTSAYGHQGRELGTSVKVMVEGPYGGVGNTIISSYSSAMLVVGGSGVTFALSAVQDLIQSGYSSNVTHIDIVWSVVDPTSLTPMVPLFAALISQCTAAHLRISVFYTRASNKSLDGMYLPSGVTLTPGRPNVAKHLDALVSSTMSNGGCSGVFVGICGPASFANGVSESVRCFDLQLKRSVGGIEVHREVFDW